MNVFGKITLRTLLQNKSRTMVTIIGVILSTAMITAITVFLSSLRDYAVKTTIAAEGGWHTLIYTMDAEETDGLEENDEVDTVTPIENVGWALIPELDSPSMPYLYVTGFTREAFSRLPVELTEGRLPQNSREIVLPDHFNANLGEKTYQIGDTITLELGRRVMEGEEMHQHNPYMDGSAGAKEALEDVHTVSYTITGFCRRLTVLEDYSSPGYTAITMSGEAADPAHSFNCLVTLKNPRKVYEFVQKTAQDHSATYHENLLIYLGVTKNTNFYTVIRRLAAILILLIMTGSIALIYNAFSISFSERTKQFGLLSSIGATPKQLSRVILREAWLISLTGIPIGLLCGIGGIGITLYLVGDLFSLVFYNSSNIALSLSVSALSVIAAVLVAGATVLISAWIPSRRAKRMTAIDAIRQRQDVKLRPERVKTSGLVYRLFHLEGMLARKYFKRNRRKYRTTIVSLVLSIVLFVSISSFTGLLKVSMGIVFYPPGCDIVYQNYSTDPEIAGQVEELYRQAAALSGVEESGYVHVFTQYAKFAPEQLSAAAITRAGEDSMIGDDGSVTQAVYVCAVSDSRMRELLQAEGMDEAPFFSGSEVHGLLYDELHLYNPSTGRYSMANVFSTDDSPVALSLDNAADSIVYGDAFIGEVPVEVEAVNAQGILLIISDTQYQTHFTAEELDAAHCIGLKVTDNGEVCDELRALVTAQEGPICEDGFIWSAGEEYRRDRGLVLVVNVFSYGFIVLITLISMVNVFNTITTNIQLRRRDFAMLKSVGMTPKGMLRMLNYECIIYGLRALAIGLPMAILVSSALYYAFAPGVELTFILPWESMLIAAAGVFVIVFVTMLYSMRKIRRENVIDALKNENL